MILRLFIFCAFLAAAAPTNIVMIVVDDLGYADWRTPQIDRLANSGTRYTQAYATVPICNASRIAIMTGCYQQRQGVSWYNGPGLHRADIPTLAEILKSQGYTTGYIGKYHHGASDRSDKRGFPLNHGFDRFFGFAGGTKHYLHHSAEFAAGKDMLHEGPMWGQRERRDVEGFSTQLFGDRARDFISEHRDSPFYLHLSFNAVHNFVHQLPPSYLADQGLKGFADLADGEDYWQWRKNIGYPAHPEGRAYYLGQLHFLDLEIGRLLDQIEALGIRERTAILLVSDNGGSLVTYADNSPLAGGKYTLFEGGTRVPMIVSCPGRIPEGAVSDLPVSTLDLLPTACALADAPIPTNLDGQSLLSPIGPRDLFWDTGHQRAIRRGGWKLLRTRKSPNPRLQITPTPTGTFLYNLRDDPGETRNLATAYPHRVAELSAALKAWNPKPQ
ncbi:MAG: arylsulfatase B [Rhodothermales bacterium]|jgi:arylsulfatase B